MSIIYNDLFIYTIDKMSTTGHYSSAMLWLHSNEYNPRDHGIVKRFMGYVKPVSHVYKYKVGCLLLYTVIIGFVCPLNVNIYN